MAEYGTPTPAGPTPSFDRRYDTEADAGAALQWMIENQNASKDIEYLGGIYKDPDTGKYGLTRLHSSFATNGVKTADVQDILTHPGLVGLGHNHPRTDPTIPQDLVDMLSLQDQKTGMGQGVGSAGKPLNMYLSGMRLDKQLPKESVLPPDSRDSMTMGQRVGGQMVKTRAVQGDPLLGGIPMDDMKLYMARKIMANQVMPATMKQKILANLIPGYGQ